MIFLRKKNKIAQARERGFTLVELLIAVGIFLVVITISLGSILSILDAGRKARALTSVMTNLNFAVEVMSREIKFGSRYYCGINTANPHNSTQNCSGAGLEPQPSITFRNSSGSDIIYRLNGNRIEKSIDHGTTYIGVTAGEVNIQKLAFHVIGATAGDGLQPRVLMVVHGYAGNKPSLQSNFIIQTVVSQRALDS